MQYLTLYKPIRANVIKSANQPLHVSWHGLMAKEAMLVDHYYRVVSLILTECLIQNLTLNSQKMLTCKISEPELNIIHNFLYIN